MRNHGTMNSSSFLYVLFRIVFLAVLCRYVVSNGSNLFGGGGSESSLSLSSSPLIWPTRILLVSRGGDEESDTSGESAEPNQTQPERRPQHEDLGNEEVDVLMDDCETLYKTVETTETSSQSFVEFDGENNRSISFREAGTYSNDTYALAMAGTSLWDNEHDAIIEWQDEDEEDSNEHGGRQGNSSDVQIYENIDIDIATLSTAADSATATANANSVTHQSDLTLPGRQVHIVTTAALPWMTGTAVNPLLRAAYLHRRLMVINNDEPPPSSEATMSNNSTSPRVANSSSLKSWVTLVVPWLELPEDQEEVYNGRVFVSMEEQEAYIRSWLRNDAGMPDAADGLSIVFYPARYHSQLHSVFAMGDIIDQLPEQQRHNLDVCILEEPEHLNWFRAPGDGWTKRYKFVLGIVHTNYKEYASTQLHGVFSAPALSLMSTAMVRAYCHKVVKLSDVLQTFAPEKETTSNVHGVRGDFLSSSTLPTDDDLATAETNATIEVKVQHSDRKAYFIGKLLWAKGLDLMLSMEDHYKYATGEYFPIDIYGSGPDQKEISRAFLGLRKFGSAGSGAGSSSITDKSGIRRRKESRNTRTNGSSVANSGSSVRKAILTNVFAWANRRSIFQKRRRKTSTAADDQSNQSRSIEEIYVEMLRSIESLPIKARESLEKLHANAKESLSQFVEHADETLLLQANKILSSSNSTTEDIANLLETIHGKAKATLEQLSEDLPKTFYELRRQPIPSTFPGRVDHAALKDSHSIFINPSVSEVLCTTTAEALAMGKFAIIPVHPSNTFFLKFPNCLAYRNKMEFVANLRWALTHDPEPLTPELAREFTWEAATDRLIYAAAITHQEAIERERLGRSRLDSRIAWIHNELGKFDVVRKVFGAGPVSDQVKYEEQRTYTNTEHEMTPSKRRRRRRASRESTRSNLASDEAGEENMIESEGGDVVDSEGLLESRKFRNSPFVQAIRAAAANGLSTRTV